MFRWNMSLETGHDGIDQARRALIEALADFFRILDDPALDRRMVAEKTGAIYAAMKAAFAAEDALLEEWGDDGHRSTHGALMLSYVDLCKRVVPKIKGLKQAQQTCLEIYRIIDSGIFRHVKDETLRYKALTRQRKIA